MEFLVIFLGCLQPIFISGIFIICHFRVYVSVYRVLLWFSLLSCLFVYMVLLWFFSPFLLASSNPFVQDFFIHSKPLAKLNLIPQDSI